MAFFVRPSIFDSGVQYWPRRPPPSNIGPRANNGSGDRLQAILARAQIKKNSVQFHARTGTLNLNYYYLGSYLNGYSRFCTPHMMGIRSINSLKSLLHYHVSLLQCHVLSLLHCHVLSLLHCQSRVIIIASSRVIVIAPSRVIVIVLAELG